MADEYTPVSSGLPEDESPLTAAEDFVPTFYGAELYAPGDAELTHSGDSEPAVGTALASLTLDESMLASGLATSLAYKAQLAGGLFNADFQLGPPRPNEPIGENNPLPYWRYGDHTDTPGELAPALYWVEDSTSPGGYSIKCVGDYAMTGAAGGYAFLEQVVPISPRQRVIMPTGVYSYDSSYVGGGNGQLSLGRIDVLLFDSSGNVVGGPAYGWMGQPNQGYTGHGDGPDDLCFVPVRVPKGARYALVRYYFFSDTDSGESEPEVLYLREAAAREPRIRWVSLSFYYENIPANGQNPWYLASMNATTGTMPAGAAQYFTPGPGWVESLSMNTAGSRTAGTLKVQVYDATVGYCNGPYLQVDANHVGNASPRLYAGGGPPEDGLVGSVHPDASGTVGADESSWVFAAGDVIRVEGLTSSFSPTTLDAVVHVQLAIIDEDWADNKNHT